MIVSCAILAPRIRTYRGDKPEGIICRWYAPQIRQCHFHLEALLQTARLQGGVPLVDLASTPKHGIFDSLQIVAILDIYRVN